MYPISNALLPPLPGAGERASERVDERAGHVKAVAGGRVCLCEMMAGLFSVFYSPANSPRIASGIISQQIASRIISPARNIIILF